MTIPTPLITTEDVRLALNGTFTGSTYYFWGQAISSGSVLAQINLANYYLYGVLGETKMDSTDAVTYYHLRACELDYACMRLLTVLSGDVIIDGFNWSASGLSIQQPLLLTTYRNLIEQFKESAQMHLRAIQPIEVHADAEQPTYQDTAPSVF